MNGVQIITVSALSLLLAGGALAIAGASFYDAAQAKRAQRRSKHPQARALRRRPLISIAITAGQDETAFKDCLDTLAAGYYRKYELIIIYKSRESVKTVLKRFETVHPTKMVRLVPGGPNSRQKALKKANGELIMLMDRPLKLDKNSLKQAADNFALEPKANIGLIEPAINAQPTLANLQYRFNSAANAQLRKAALAYGLIGLASQPAVYRRQFLVSKRPSNTFPVRPAGWLAAALAAALGAYGIYLAVASVTVYLLAILWSGFGLFLLLAIWSDSRFSLSQKSKLSLLTPPLSGWLYLNLLFSVFKSAAKTVSKP